MRIEISGINTETSGLYYALCFTDRAEMETFARTLLASPDVVAMDEYRVKLVTKDSNLTQFKIDS